MKERLEVKAFKPGILSVHDLALMHARVSGDLAVSDMLIYGDPNFEHYLANRVIPDKKNSVAVLLQDGVPKGFSRIRELGDTLFLNNIYVDYSLRGGGCGKWFLRESINIIQNNEKFFELDVFRSNEQAYKWYQRLGMEEISGTYWYNIKMLSPSTDIAHTPIKRLKDENGFTGLYIGGSRVGSVINKNVILTDSTALKHNAFIGYNICIKSGSEVVSTNSYTAELIEVSARLRHTLIEVTKNLNL